MKSRKYHREIKLSLTTLLLAGSGALVLRLRKSRGDIK